MNKKNFALLTSIAAAMKVEATPYLMVTEAQAKDLVAEGLVETNDEFKDGNKIAARATEAGMKALADGEAANSETANAGSMIEIDDGITMPKTRAGRTSVNYPFDKLDVGQSFHIPKTADRENPAKSMASTVSAATKKYGEPTGETKITSKGNELPVLDYKRRFSVKAVGADDPKGEGARVWRTL